MRARSEIMKVVIFKGFQSAFISMRCRIDRRVALV
jgi:hypothetical protein